jgi:microcystin-dependent protein
MKTKTQIFSTFALLILALTSTSALAQTTAFNYTGFLLDGTNAVTGGSDLQFTLYAAPTGGSPLAGSVTITNQPVNNGVFVASLDFGDVFDGPARWLEISARPGGSANPFTNTFPRQAITAAPYSTFANNGVPPGNISASASTSVPAGWLLCDGSAVSRTNYARLFSAVGTNWGIGNGTTTFNLPDLRGMFLRGAGANGSIKDAVNNYFSGAMVGTYQQDQMQGHYHNALLLNGCCAPASASSHIPPSTPGSATAQVSGNSVGDAVANASNGTPRTGAETKPASYSVNYIIKF